MEAESLANSANPANLQKMDSTATFMNTHETNILYPNVLRIIEISLQTLANPHTIKKIWYTYGENGGNVCLGMRVAILN